MLYGKNYVFVNFLKAQQSDKIRMMMTISCYEMQGEHLEEKNEKRKSALVTNKK